MCSLAKSYASLNSEFFSVTMSPAAAFKQTAFEKSLSTPLNIRIDLDPKDIEEQINKNNFGFMFAPNYHRAMRFVGPTRKKIGKRTIFNMIGPLSLSLIHI